MKARKGESTAVDAGRVGVALLAAVPAFAWVFVFDFDGALVLLFTAAFLLVAAFCALAVAGWVFFALALVAVDLGAVFLAGVFAALVAALALLATFFFGALSAAGLASDLAALVLLGAFFLAVDLVLVFLPDDPAMSASL